MTTSSEFLKVRLQNHMKKMNKRLGDYIKDPSNEENIHDIRTSIRRFDSSFTLLPTSLRKSNSKIRENYKQFFRINSTLRDYDVISKRLELNGKTNNEKSSQLQKKKQYEVKKALKIAKSLQDLPEINFNGISDEKLQKRIDKVTNKYLDRIKKLLPVVLKDSKNVEAIHQLRKDCKKLRYILEILSEPTRKKYEIKFSEIFPISHNKRKNNILEELQDLLGEIHDSDITIEHLSKIKSEKARMDIASEKNKRRQLYVKFRNYVKNGINP